MPFFTKKEKKSFTQLLFQLTTSKSNPETKEDLTPIPKEEKMEEKEEDKKEKKDDKEEIKSIKNLQKKPIVSILALIY